MAMRMWRKRERERSPLLSPAPEAPCGWSRCGTFPPAPGSCNPRPPQQFPLTMVVGPRPPLAEERHSYPLPLHHCRAPWVGHCSSFFLAVRRTHTHNAQMHTNTHT